MQVILIKLSTGTLAFTRPAYGMRLVEIQVPVEEGGELRSRTLTLTLEEVYAAQFGKRGMPYAEMVAELNPTFSETEGEFASRIGELTIEKMARDGQPGFAGANVVAIVDESTIPADETSWKYRDAWDWTSDEPAMDIDLPKARELRLAALRKQRDAELEKLDVDAVRGLETEDRAEITRVAARKQILRDAPQTLRPVLDGAGSLDDLEAIGLP
jgi:hypothetical protein